MVGYQGLPEESPAEGFDDPAVKPQAREDALRVEKLARGLAYVFAYKQAKKACENPTASKEVWKTLASAKIDRDWHLFIPDATLLQEALTALQAEQKKT